LLDTQDGLLASCMRN